WYRLARAIARIHTATFLSRSRCSRCRANRFAGLPRSSAAKPTCPPSEPAAAAAVCVFSVAIARTTPGTRRKMSNPETPNPLATRSVDYFPPCAARRRAENSRDETSCRELVRRHVVPTSCCDGRVREPGTHVCESARRAQLAVLDAPGVVDGRCFGWTAPHQG